MKTEEIKKVVADYIAGGDIMLIDVVISAGNEIEVTLDSPQGVTIDKCIEISRHIESLYDRDKEDFELTVASASISEPFKVKMQYEKHIGKEVEVFTNDNRKLVGLLHNVSDEGFILTYDEKVVVEGRKRKEIQTVELPVLFSEVRTTKLTFKF